MKRELPPHSLKSREARKPRKSALGRSAALSRSRRFASTAAGSDAAATSPVQRASKARRRSSARGWLLTKRMDRAAPGFLFFFAPENAFASRRKGELFPV